MEKGKNNIHAQCLVTVRKLQENVKTMQQNVKEMQQNKLEYKEKITKISHENNIMKSILPDLLILLKALKQDHYDLFKYTVI